MKRTLTFIGVLMLPACKKEDVPLQSGTITWYHEVNHKIVSVLDIPSAFTPNGDGINDAFRPVLRGCHYFGFEMKVFNASKQLIFMTNDANTYWDGISKGTKATPGRYFYTVKALDTTGYFYAVSYGFHLVR